MIKKVFKKKSKKTKKEKNKNRIIYEQKIIDSFGTFIHY
jgi:isocitrate dehydrogenase